MTGSGATDAICRRDLLKITGAGLAAIGLDARAADAQAPRCGEAEEIALWPEGAPGGQKIAATETLELPAPDETRFATRRARHITHPRLFVFRPRRPNGSALLVIPGGAYVIVATDIEGCDIAHRWTTQGVTVFVLNYRLPGDGWTAGPDAPLQDAQRALRLIRHNAARLGIDAERVGVMGFSAGGHLAGSLATRFAARVYEPVDVADRLSCRPDLACLVYPVVTMRTPPDTYWRRQLLGASADDALAARYSLEVDPPRDTPPTLLLHAADDPLVAPGNSIDFFTALRRVGVGAELHVFEEGGHGFGLRLEPGKPASGWPALLDKFAARHQVPLG